MTKDKVIEEVKNYDNYPNGLSKECRDYIIETLEQKLSINEILDKLRAEIETEYGQCSICKYDSWDENWYEVGDIADILQIIDEYKMEGKND